MKPIFTSISSALKKSGFIDNITGGKSRPFFSLPIYGRVPTPTGVGERAPPGAPLNNPPPAQSAGAPFTQGGLFRAVGAVQIRPCPFGRIIRSYTKESDVMGSAFTSRYVRTMPSPAGDGKRSSGTLGCFFWYLFLQKQEKYILPHLVCQILLVFPTEFYFFARKTDQNVDLCCFCIVFANFFHKLY